MGLLVRKRKHVFLRVVPMYFAIFFFVCLQLTPFIAAAQTTPFSPANDPNAIQSISSTQSYSGSAVSGSTGSHIPTADEIANAAQAGVAAPVQTSNQLTGAQITNPGVGQANGAGANTPGTGGQIDDTQSTIYNIAVGLGGWIAGLGGSIFDLAIDKVVIHLGCWFVTSGGTQCAGYLGQGSIGAVVNTLWKVIRDLFNILFIGGLVFIGLRTILDADDSSTQKALGSLIMAALLINFSLYITKAIVDVSDYTAVAINAVATQNVQGQFGYQAASTNASGAINNVSGTYTSADHSLSGAYMQTLQISSWFSHGIFGSGAQIIVFSIVVLIFSVILGLTLAYGGIMLIARFIALIIYMIFSPVMFLGWVLPSWKKYSTQWWDGFLSYAFFAPAYIFMLYVGLYSLIQMQTIFTGNNSSFSAAFSTSWGTQTFMIFLYFAIGIGFLVAATRVGEKMSKAGSAGTMNVVSNIKKQGLGALNYGVGYGASAASGWGARKVGGYMDKKSAESDEPRSRWARYRREFVAKGEKAKFGGTQSSSERIKGDKEEAKRHARAHTVYDVKSTIETNAGKTDRDSRIALDTAINGASNAQILEMAKNKKGMETLHKIAGSLSDSQIKAIMDSEDITDETKQKFSSARKINLKSKIAENGGFTKGLGGATTSQLDSLNLKDDLLPNAKYLQSSQMDDLKKKWGDNESYRILAEERKTQLKNGDINEIIKTRKGDKEIAKLPDDVLKEATTIAALDAEGKLSADLLGHILRESGVDKKVIGKHVLDHYGANDNLDNAPADIAAYFKSGPGIAFLPAGFRMRAPKTTSTTSSSSFSTNQAAFQARAAAAQSNKNRPVKR